MTNLKNEDKARFGGYEILESVGCILVTNGDNAGKVFEMKHRDMGGVINVSKFGISMLKDQLRYCQLDSYWSAWESMNMKSKGTHIVKCSSEFYKSLSNEDLATINKYERRYWFNG